MRSEAPPQYAAWFRCPSAGCASRRWSLNEVVYRCPECGGLLEVEHDLEALRAVRGSRWRQALDERAAGGHLGIRSGVWAQREWVHPLLGPGHLVSLGEGDTPLVSTSLRRGPGATWLKQCGTSHTGSFKDLGMTVLVSQVHQMRAQGQPLRAVACASTGDTSAALAAYGARAGVPTIVLLPADKVSTAQLIQPVVHGAHVLALETDFDGCMRIVQEVTADGTIYLANSMNSLRIEGQKTISLEICRQLDWRVPDWVILPGGNLGNVFALWRGFELGVALGIIDRLPRLAVAQAAAANPLYLAFQRGFEGFEPQTARPTAASAIRIGDPVSLERAVRALRATNGVVAQADEQELADAAARAGREGHFACPHTAVALAALHKLAAAEVIRPDDEVVVVATAHGLKFTDWMVAYHERRVAGVESTMANPPTPLPADPDAVREALDRLLRA